MLKHIDHSWADFEKTIFTIIKSDEVKSILEIGGGANPFLSEEKVNKYSLDYTIVDISSEELNKSQNPTARKINQDISKEPLKGQFDLIFSQMVLEHITDPESFHCSVRIMMKPSSTACHFFATKYGLPSLLNLILPSKFTDYIIYKFQKRDPEKEGKFKAYYRRCTGPLPKTSSWLSNIGYDIEKYIGYVGHGYLGQLKVIGQAERWFSKVLLRLNSPYLSSNAILVMKKSNL